MNKPFTLLLSLLKIVENIIPKPKEINNRGIIKPKATLLFINCSLDSAPAINSIMLIEIAITLLCTKKFSIFSMLNKAPFIYTLTNRGKLINVILLDKLEDLAYILIATAVPLYLKLSCPASKLWEWILQYIREF